MKYANLFSFKSTPQSQAIPGSGQLPNSAGGYTWSVGPMGQLDRFLILGSEQPTYYATAQALTYENANNLINLIDTDGESVVARIIEISTTGRAPKNDAAVFALALAASVGSDQVRTLALNAVPTVCRTGTHLFQFVECVEKMRGWGRGLRRAVGNWYNAKPVQELEYQLLKYQQREGWSNRDLLRLSHAKPASDEHAKLYRWAVKGDVPDAQFARLTATKEAAVAVNAAEVAKLIREANLPREAVPTQWLTDPLVWEALLESMPMMAMIRNLATLSRVGLLQPGSQATRKVVNQLRDTDRLRRARIHPISVLLALSTYRAGKGMAAGRTWIPNPEIVDALDEAFYATFQNVQPTGKRFLLGLDVSGSMDCSTVAGSHLTPRCAASAMAMLTVATEPHVTTMAFTDRFVPVDLSRRRRLDDVIKTTQALPFGRTDCAVPMLWALEKKLAVDVFVIYTDNETWYGGVHPAEALKRYRKEMGIGAKLIVVGMTTTRFTIADPSDPGMLDVVGFDAAVPTVMSEFINELTELI